MDKHTCNQFKKQLLAGRLVSIKSAHRKEQPPPRKTDFYGLLKGLGALTSNAATGSYWTTSGILMFFFIAAVKNVC